MNRLSVYVFSIVSVCLFAADILRADVTPRLLRFDNPVVDVDTVRQDAGPVTVRFVYTNISDKDVRILDVHAQCGCTRPVYSREPVPQGEKGFVDVTLDPKNLFARQERHLTVIATNGDYRKFSTITINGYVDNGMTEDELHYPFEIAPGLRSETAAVGMRLHERGERPVKEFAICNVSGSSIPLGWIPGSDVVSAEMPDTLVAGEKCRIRVTVNTLPIPEGRYEESLYLVAGRDTVRIPLKGAVREASWQQGNTVLIPEPKDIYFGRECFQLPVFPKVSVQDSSLFPACSYLYSALARKDWLWNASAFEAAESPVGCGNAGCGSPDVAFVRDSTLEPEEYCLDILADGVTIRSGSCQGAINAVSTLRQLLWESGRCLPTVSVHDYPRFAWRGAMLDVARHFFSVDEVKMLIDRLALYKFNRLHLHLTDDQGWRVEIPCLPRLTSEGAWGALNSKDSLCLKLASELKDGKYLLPESKMKDGMPGGYYSADDIRALVSYADIRGIEIVPEIDFPGHSLAVLKAYPEFSCSGKGGKWGKAFSTPLCMENSRTADFCKEVFLEIFRLFPSRYIHIGGDEVDPSAWGKCPECRRLMASRGITDPRDLQAGFTRDLERFCKENGKTVIGWDEVASDGLSPESMVMWWRNWAPETLSASMAQGHDVVVSSSEYYYLAPDQDRNSLHKTYSYEPGTSACNPSRIAGIQGHLWSEKAPTIESVGERIFPRLIAIAETGWVEAEQKDFASFERRLPLHLEDLDRSGWKYRFGDVSGVFDMNVFIDRATVELSVPERAVLRYTLDGSIPDMDSPVYSGSFEIREDCTMKMRCYNSRGIAGDLKTAVFRKTGLMPAVDEYIASGSPAGVRVRWYDYKGESCREIDSASLKKEFVCSGIGIPAGVCGNIGLVSDCYIDIPEDGIYSFYTYSDDGSILEIDGVVVVDNDGPHSRVERTGQAALAKGRHRMSLLYFDSNGGIFEAGFTDRSGRHIPFSPEILILM